jgi:SHAQKYF class myb-like DNA-binding protein
MSGPPSYSSHGYRGAPGRVTNNGMSADGTEVDLDDARAIKRPRLVWTAQLHKRFEDAITKLGDKKAVPKNIMQVRRWAMLCSKMGLATLFWLLS